MKLLVVSSYFDTHPGGLEVVAGRLARELAALGHAVDWAATDASAIPADRDVAASGLSATNVIEVRTGLPLPILTPSGIARLDRRVRASDVVLIHDTLYSTSVCAFLSARRHRRPVLLLQHLGDARFGDPVTQALARLGERLVTRPMLSAADQVVFISETVGQHFAGVALKRPARVSFSGVDTGVFRPCADEVQRDRLRTAFEFSGTVALYVGRFVATKGLETLRALAAMRPDLTLAMAGWGPVDPETWGLPNVQVLRGLAGAGLADLYRAADAFVLASPSESFSLVVREALACGLPVICGERVAATDTELAPFVSTFEIDPGDAAGAARRMAGLVDAAVVAPRDAGAVAFVSARYDWRQVAALYNGLIESLARSPQASPASLVLAA